MRPNGSRARARSRNLALAVVSLLVAGTGLTACSDQPGPPAAAPIAQALIAEWNHQAYGVMGRQVVGLATGAKGKTTARLGPGSRVGAGSTTVAGAASSELGVVLTDEVEGLDATSVVHVLGAIRGRGPTRTVDVINRFTLGGLGSWTATGKIQLELVGQQWRFEWSPQWVDSRLSTGDRLRLTVGAWPARGAILGAGGAPLTTVAPMVTVGLLGSRITSPTALSAGLLQAGLPASQVAAAIATATAQPTLFIPMETLPESEYETLKPLIYPLPGTVFQSTDTRTAISPDLGAQIVGSLTTLTASGASELGTPYQPGDIVGQTGIEGEYERQLAGTPQASVEVVGANGATRATVATFAQRPGSTVQTTIDPATQQAAEEALNGISKAAALVAIQPSTGDVLASVSRPTEGFNVAINGRYPPGSTFKVITSADLIEHGLNPQSPASCPATITEGGETFHNFEGETTPSLSLEQAFAESCNAAFIGLAANLPDSSFPATAAQFGLGADIRMGLPAYGGSVPTPGSDAIRAATAIGQADVLVSPLDMAVVAATAESGVLREPRLVVGAPDDSVPPQPLPPSVVTDLHEMMAAVVADGTASGEGLPSGTSGKTGTAEFGTANPPATHAWFIGYNGDLAFAVLVVGGGIGGAVAAPVAAQFLDNLGVG